jgi:uncharacterized membrane protein YraQ (UPF0718 family)
VRKTQHERGMNRSRRPRRAWLFPLAVLAAYGVLWGSSPDRIGRAFLASAHVLRQVSLPLLLAFVMMLLLNRFVTPAHATRFLGRRAGVLGLLLSSAAGVVSMGPVYAWYPFLASLREKGASDFHLANFLGQRAVKPVLLPLMIAYFGWRFSLVFTVVSGLSAVLAAAVVGAMSREDTSFSSRSRP